MPQVDARLTCVNAPQNVRWRLPGPQGRVPPATELTRPTVDLGRSQLGSVGHERRELELLKVKRLALPGRQSPKYDRRIGPNASDCAGFWDEILGFWDSDPVLKETDGTAENRLNVRNFNRSCGRAGRGALSGGAS